MKKKSFALVTGAGTATLLFLAACQQSESPVQSAAPETATTAADGAENAPVQPTGPGRQLTAEEVARILKMSKPMQAPRPTTVEAPLAKKAVLPSCNVNFNSSTGLGNIPNQANQGTATFPFYRQTCNTSYTVTSWPVNYVNYRYRLIPENANWCAGPVPKIGTRSGAYCTNHSDGKFWPRRLGNSENASGVSFNVEDATHYKDFDLKSLYVHSGNVDVYVFVPTGGWLHWPNLASGIVHGFPPGTKAGQVQIFKTGGNGLFLVDNLTIAIHP